MNVSRAPRNAAKGPTGLAPQLVVLADYYAGLPADTVLATATLDRGQRQQLIGVVPPMSADTELSFCVDASVLSTGGATYGFVSVDGWEVA